MKKGIIVGVLTALISLILVLILAYFSFTYMLTTVFVLYLTLGAISILIYKYKYDRHLSTDLGIIIGCVAYLAFIVLFLLTFTTSAEYTLYMVVGISFFSMLFGLILSILSAALIVKK